MVSRRNFFTISVMLLILAFMFLFTGVTKQALNEYDVNVHAQVNVSAHFDEEMFYAQPFDPASDLSGREYILFAGNKDSADLREVTVWWCTYTKRGFAECESIADYDFPAKNLPRAVVIDGLCMDPKKDLDPLISLTQSGVHIIFARLPEQGVITTNRDLQSFLGISRIIGAKTKVDGLHLFAGFALGGERIYEEEKEHPERMDSLSLTMPWYVTGSGTKTYCMGILNDDTVKNEDLPAVIWRNSVGNAKVFAVNYDCFSDMSGIGFLNAMLSDAEAFEIYPVINAQNLTIAGFSGFADENATELDRLYNRSQVALYREILWPALVALREKSGNRMSIMMAPQLNYLDLNEPNPQLYEYYLKLLNEIGAEAGVSMGTEFETPVWDKLTQDKQFFDEGVANYKLLTLYQDDVRDCSTSVLREIYTDLRTVTAQGYDIDPYVNYLDRETLFQRLTHRAQDYGYGEDLKLIGVETGLGYSNVLVDLKSVSFPQTSKDRWENFSREITETICTYWNSFRGLDKTTLSESDVRVRRFLALDYTKEDTDRGVALHLDHFEEQAWFYLKLNTGEVEYVEGGTFTDLQNGYYLIEATSSDVEIIFSASTTRFY